MVSTETPRDQLRGRETKQRVLAAAAAEFAEYGVAGARINRIAQTAKASKERIYAWFGDKDALFDHVMQTGLDRLARAVPIDADLVEYTVRLHTYFVSEEAAQRVTMWAWLHDVEKLGAFSQARVEGYRHKLAVIRDAQERGIVDATWKPEELLALLLAVASNWERAPAELRSLGSAEFAADDATRAESVRAAARRLVEPRR
ncbi:Transcriptional regulator, TetR family [Leifsonia rubra CMS 76R]|nr:Transcriptional regulator, TetR family [Leifsonia rubra CMS 76R]